MALFEDNTQVFIVRVWIERREIEGAKVEWRGVIEHVPSGEKRYFQRLEQMPGIIGTYVWASMAPPAERKSVFQWIREFF